MKSKENELLELFFESPKHWHFEELRKTAKISKPQLAKWLSIFKNEGIIKRIKDNNKMPYYVQNFENLKFQNQKKFFGYKKLMESGLFDHLSSLIDAKVIILFGSFARYDWKKESDIDIFIFGNDKNFEKGKYELKIKRDIQLHNAKNKKDLKKMDKLLPYILSGNFIKGTINDLGVEIHAKT